MVKHSFVSMMLAITILTDGYGQPTELEKKAPALEFANVVVVDSSSMQLLFQSAVKYTTSLKNRDENFELKLKDSIDGKLYGQSTFFVYSQSGILKKISGTITYQVSVEVKDNKYRYQFSNFIFNYYKQDRNFNWVATGQTKNLDETNAPGWQKLWAAHRKTCSLQLTEDTELLTKIMKEKPVMVKKNEVKKVEW